MTGQGEPRLLFVPVSAARGSGEYARCLLIADSARARWPAARVHFVVSREAPYADRIPYACTRLPSSPSFHVREVVALIHEFRPHLVVFDNSGRTAQLRAARAVGARIVFVSSRVNRRRRGFRLQWLSLIDEHWIAYPEIIAGSLSLLERLLLRGERRPKVRFLCSLMPDEEPERDRLVLERHGLAADGYVLVAPGGGIGHRSMADAPGVIASAALRIAQSGVRTTTVGLSVPSGAATPATLLQLPRVAMDELLALIRSARLVITNGADTLIQVMVCGRPCIAVPMSPDQKERLRRLQRTGVAIGVPLDEQAILAETVRLLEDDAARDERARIVARLGFRNEMPTALAAIEALLARSKGSGAPLLGNAADASA